jgi:hypothetical protein
LDLLVLFKFLPEPHLEDSLAAILRSKLGAEIHREEAM